MLRATASAVSTSWDFHTLRIAEEILEILFQRYDLGDAEASQEYEVKLLITQDHIVSRIHWNECPVPLMKQFTQKGKSCGIVLERAANLPLLFGGKFLQTDSRLVRILETSQIGKDHKLFAKPSAPTWVESGTGAEADKFTFTRQRFFSSDQHQSYHSFSFYKTSRANR